MQSNFKALGSTDISAIAGTNSFAGPWEVYNRLTKKLPDDDKPHLRIGRDIEWFVITDAFKHLDPYWLCRFGLEERCVETYTLKKEKARYFDAAHALRDSYESNYGTKLCTGKVMGETPLFRSTPDGRVVSNPRAQRPVITIEAKTAFYADRQLWGNPLPTPEEAEEAPITESQVPAAYYDQAQWHMAATGTGICILPVIFDFTSNPVVYWVQRNSRRIRELVWLGTEFWNSYIIGDATPPPDASDGMKLHLALQEVQSADYIPAEDGDYDMVRQLFAAREAKKTAAAIEAEYQNRLRLRVVTAGASGISFDGEFKGRFNFKMNKSGKRIMSMKGLKAA